MVLADDRLQLEPAGLADLMPGTYVIMVEQDGATYRQKVVKAP
jgi:hypothetical protein